MKKRKKVKQQFCYVCQAYFPEHFFKEHGHYDRSRLEDESRRLASIDPRFNTTDLSDYYIKGVSKQTRHLLARARAIPVLH